MNRKLVETEEVNISSLKIVSFTPIPNDKRNTKVIVAETKEQILSVLTQPKINSYVQIKNQTYHILNNLPFNVDDKKETIITLCSGGYSNNGNPYSYCGYLSIKTGVCPENATCITFEFPTDTFRKFNFCQTDDLNCIKDILTYILRCYKKPQIILYGGCKGATCFMNFLSEQVKSGDKEHFLPFIKIIIAESPPISVNSALQRTPCYCLSINVLKYCFPNFNHDQETILDKRYYPLIPTLIGSLPGDTIAERKDLLLLQKRLNDIAKKEIVESLTLNVCEIISIFLSEDNSLIHGQLAKDQKYQVFVKEFVKKNLSDNKIKNEIKN